LERHPEYKFNIGHVSKNDRWIYIKDDSDTGWYDAMMGFREYDGPVEFLKRIIDKTGWTIQPTEMGYVFAEDPLQLEYQFDDLFGLTVEYLNEWALEETMKFLMQFTGSSAIKQLDPYKVAKN